MRRARIPAPNRPARVLRPDIAPGRRVLVISDIHGQLSFLKGVLDKVGFSPDDVLILLGDMLEKGPDSLATLRYILRLQRTHTVYALCGNCDHIDRVFLEGLPHVDEDLWPVFDFWWRRGLIAQMAAELGLPITGPGDLPGIRRAILERLPDEADFLLELPHILEAGRYIFVHGGVPRETDLDSLPEYTCLKNDDFLGQGLTFDKWVVVGHWPVTLYDPRIASAAPIITRDRHIISIDGGCVLKADGQLNALIIPDVYRDEVEWAAYDGLPLVTALDDQAPSDDPFNLRWSDSVVEVVREEEDCCLCRHVTTGRELWVLREYLYCRRSDRQLHCEDSTDYRLPVAAGDVLSLVRSCSLGHLVKKNGVTGWYMGRIGKSAPAG